MEENGKEDFRRPVLVINRIGGLFFVVPLSTKEKDNKFYYRLTSVDFKKPSLVMLSQARVIDKKRFMNKIGEISDEEFQKIKKFLRKMYLPGN
jgi:mRNA-degrading endonuclease toxin of MazEF toxin-antitoxin module